MLNKETVQEWTPVILVWACLLLLPVGRTVEVPVAIMALLGLVQCFRQGWRSCVRGPHGFFSLVMLLFWLPQILSLIDAVHFSRAFGGVLSFLRFYFSGLYIISSFSSAKPVDRLLRLCSIILVFWVVDGLVQMFAGVDVFGFPKFPVRINGVFGDKLKLGPYLAIYSPVLICYVRSKFHLVLQWLVYLATLLVLLLAGSRSSWVMFAFISIGFFVFEFIGSGSFRVRYLAIGLCLGAVLFVAAPKLYPPLQKRFQQTELLFKGDRKSVDTALSKRLEIWAVALQMIKDHPVTGVGVRGFRYAYPAYVGPDDIYMKLSGGKTGPTHSHMLALEILTETGIIGFLGYLGAACLLLLRWLRSSRIRKSSLLPFALATMASLLPFNTHMAFYSAALAQVIFLFVALYCCNIVDLNPDESSVDEATV